MFDLLTDSAAEGRTPAWHAAYLEDRIALYEGRSQRFGSQWLDDPRDGRRLPWKLVDPERVNELRASAGLGPLPHTFPTLPSQAPTFRKNSKSGSGRTHAGGSGGWSSKGWQRK